MNSVHRWSPHVVRALAISTALVATSFTGSANSSDDQDSFHGESQGRDRFYSVHNLVSDGFVKADHLDTDLTNPWGVAFNPNGFVWVADNHAGLSTLYDGDGVKNGLIVSIPPAPGNTGPGVPTGITFSSGTDFTLTRGTLTGPSRFIFATEDGTIVAWAPAVDGTHALLAWDNSPAHSIYKGIALAGNGAGHFLYATDFHNNKIDVYDSTFHPATLSGHFFDPRIPKGFAPFGIANILGNLYVTYAKQDDDAEDDVAGQGLGFVDVFDPNGHLITRFASRGPLNAPWGMALAPADFGRFSNMLLVGNFGDGRISAYTRKGTTAWVYKGQLRLADGTPITIGGLWAIAFGNGSAAGPKNTLYFLAGPSQEQHGLLGSITVG